MSKVKVVTIYKHSVRVSIVMQTCHHVNAMIVSIVSAKERKLNISLTARRAMQTLYADGL
jgi:hypothetical protein